DGCKCDRHDQRGERNTRRVLHWRRSRLLSPLNTRIATNWIVGASNANPVRMAERGVFDDDVHAADRRETDAAPVLLFILVSVSSAPSSSAPAAEPGVGGLMIGTQAITT